MAAAASRAAVLARAPARRLGQPPPAAVLLVAEAAPRPLLLLLRRPREALGQLPLLSPGWQRAEPKGGLLCGQTPCALKLPAGLVRLPGQGQKAGRAARRPWAQGEAEELGAQPPPLLLLLLEHCQSPCRWPQPLKAWLGEVVAAAAAAAPRHQPGLARCLLAQALPPGAAPQEPPPLRHPSLPGRASKALHPTPHAGALPAGSRQGWVRTVCPRCPPQGWAGKGWAPRRCCRHDAHCPSPRPGRLALQLPVQPPAPALLQHGLHPLQALPPPGAVPARLPAPSCAPPPRRAAAGSPLPGLCSPAE